MFCVWYEKMYVDLVLMILDLFCYHKIWPIESREYADIFIIRSRITFVVLVVLLPFPFQMID